MAVDKDRRHRIHTLRSKITVHNKLRPNSHQPRRDHRNDLLDLQQDHRNRRSEMAPALVLVNLSENLQLRLNIVSLSPE